MKSKTIILSKDNESGRGILTLYIEDDLLKCRIRLYNINKLNRFCKIGVYHNKEVFSSNLLEKDGVYTSSLVGSFDIDKDFYAAIVDTSNGNNVLLSGGTYAGYYFNETSIFQREIKTENPNTNLYNYEENMDFSIPFQSNQNDDTNTQYEDYECNHTQDDNIECERLNKSSVDYQGSQRSKRSASHGICEQPTENEVHTNQCERLNKSSYDFQGSQRSKRSASHGICEQPTENEVHTNQCERLNKSSYDFQGSQRSKRSASHGICEQPTEDEVHTNQCERLNRSSCEHCRYKEFFYSCQNQNIDKHKEDFSSIDNLNTFQDYESNQEDEIHFANAQNSTNQQRKINENEIPTIIEAIKPQFKYIFENYPEDETINKLIKNSKFVKIEENSENYSIGIIEEENEIKYICYAVLCNYNTPPPKEIGNHHQWLPLDPADPLSEGYYVVFQDAVDLKIVEL